MRLIDADALKVEIVRALGIKDRRYLLPSENAIWKVINKMPIADAEPVRHGHWIIEDMYIYELSYGSTLYEPVYKCSCCGRVTESYARIDKPIMPEDADFPKFCGNCGARMDEVEE